MVSSIEAFVSTVTIFVPFLSPKTMDGMDRIRHERTRRDDCGFERNRFIEKVLSLAGWSICL
jgi:hypothetical protein